MALASFAASSAYADVLDDLALNSNGGTCDIAIQDYSQYGQQRYDSLSRYDYVEPLELRLTHNGQGRCRGVLNFDIGVNTGQLTGANGDALNFLLLDGYSSNSVLFNPQTGQTNGLMVDLQAGQSVRLKPYFYIKRRQAGHSGTYTAPIDMVFTGQTPAETRRQTLDLSAHVKASVQANFTGVARLPGVAGLSLLNLGEIAPGQVQRLGLQLRANSDVDVAFSSRHNGTMKNIQYDGEFLGYDMTIAGQPIDLSHQDAIVLGTAVSRNGVTAPVEITVENYDSAAAGVYFDIIEVRVSAR